MPRKARTVWLLATSYFFYMCWSVRYTALLALSTLITYVVGLAVSRTAAQRQKRLWLAAGLVSNLGILFFFKYFNFAVQALNTCLSVLHIRLALPTPDLLLPVGISFYTFQALSYTIDVYRGDIPAERNLLRYALYVSFFPQLVAAPIERSKNLLGQMQQEHHFDYERVKNGLLLMV